MTIQEVYEKYKHLDKILTDLEYLGYEELRDEMLGDLWKTVKDYAEKE
jgi:hypothetical protein